MKIETVVDGHSLEQWSEVVAAFCDHNLYQTWEYEQTRDDAAKTQVSRVVVTRGSNSIGAAQVRVKRIPVLGGGLAYVYRGPLWRKGCADPKDLTEVLRQLHRVFVREQGLTLRIAPNATAITEDAEWKRTFEAASFRAEKPQNADRTILVDLRPPLDELRKGLAQKWRNCLNQSERHGLNVTQSQKTDEWRHFEALYDAMWAGKQFETGVSVPTFRRLQETLAADRKMQVLLAWHEGVPIAGHVSSKLGDTCIYLLGASGDAGRQTKAAYLLQWHAATLAKEHGAHWYDLGGIDPDANPGVYHFKSGLGGVEAEFLPPYIATPGSARSFLVPIAEAAYRRLRPKAGAR